MGEGEKQNPDIFGGRIFKIPSSGMEPQLIVGDLIVVDNEHYKRRQIFREHVVTFLYPKDKKRIFIKRIIGMPGEEIAIKNNHVFINNSMFSDKHGTFDDSRHDKDRYLRTNFGPVLIPENHYFLLGDNRDNSQDSRHFGFVEKDSILGKALVIYGSAPDNSLKNIRRERTGKIIE